MRAALVLPLVSLLALAGCVDAVIDDLAPPDNEPPVLQESVEGDDNETLNVSEEEPVTPTPEPTPPTVEPTPPPPTPPPVTSTPPPATPPPPVVTPPPPTVEPTPPPPTPPPPTPPPPTPPPATTPPTPTPPPPPPPPAWPREGSHVTFEIASSTGAPDGSYRREGTMRATWTYTDGDWRGVCEGTVTESYNGDVRTETIRREFVASDPPHWPLFNTRDVDVGDPVEAWHMWWCDISSEETQVVEEDADRLRAHTVHPYATYETEWDQQTGLVLSWTDQGRNSVSRGRLASTDAPTG